MLPIVANVNGENGKSMGMSSNFGKQSMLNMNPNFLFSPHYNMVTNLSSRAESETSSLANVSVCNQSVTQNHNSMMQSCNGQRSKSISSVTIEPMDVQDLNNNNRLHIDSY